MVQEDKTRGIFNIMLEQSSHAEQDPLAWYLSMASVSPNISPEHKQAINNYQLFNMSGDGGQLYHGLNFAAYGGKVNRFAPGGYTNALNAINNAGSGFKYRIDGKDMSKDEAINYI